MLARAEECVKKNCFHKEGHKSTTSCGKVCKYKGITTAKCEK